MDQLILLREHDPELQKRLGIAKIGIFGSFAHGEERQDSDVDVLVTFQQGKKTFDNFIETKIYLKDHFIRKVDLHRCYTQKIHSRSYPERRCLNGNLTVSAGMIQGGGLE
ncbi:MAG: nucleotidyltransferase family protein [Methanobacteriota archaeon]